MISILPVRREILLGILYCDLIGFHTYDYARHFLSSCTRILGLPTVPNGVEFEGRMAHVGTFPIGIEPSSFIEVAYCFRCIRTTLSSISEPQKGVRESPHRTTRTAFQWRQGYRWCGQIRLHQRCSPEVTCVGAFLDTAP